MKRSIILIPAICMAAVLAICLAGCAKTSEDVLREAVMEEFDPYRNLEDAALDRIASIAEEEGLSELGISGVDFASSVLEGFDYTIDDVRITNDEAVVSVTIISKSASDFDAKIAERVQAFVESDESQQLDAAQRASKIGEIALESIDDAEVISQSLDIVFRLEDTTWLSTDVSDKLSKLDILAYRG